MFALISGRFYRHAALMLWPRGRRYDHICRHKIEHHVRTKRCMSFGHIRRNRVTWHLPTTNDDPCGNDDSGADDVDGDSHDYDSDDDDIVDTDFVAAHLLLPNLLQALASDRLTHIRAAAQLASAGLYKLAAASAATAAAAPTAEAVELAAAMIRHADYGMTQHQTLQQALQIASKAKLHDVAELALQDLAASNALKVMHNLWICFQKMSKCCSLMALSNYV